MGSMFSMLIQRKWKGKYMIMSATLKGKKKLVSENKNHQ